MNAGITVVCYKSKILKNGESPLMLRICKDNQKKYQSLGISVNPKHWDFSKNKPKSNCPNREYIPKIILTKQTELQEKILELNAEQKAYIGTTLLHADKQKFQLKTVAEFYQELIAQFVADDKCGNRLIYKSSYNSLYKFTKGKLDIPFCTIDVDWLKKYEKWLRSKNNRKTTADVRLIMQGALLTNAVAMILAHNHPNGSTRPSKEDDRITNQIAKAGELLNIRVLDHIILRERDFIVMKMKDEFNLIIYGY